MNIEIAIPRKAAPAIAPRLAWFKSNVDPSAGKMSPRVTNEKAEAIRAMQLATNNRRGFMHSVSGAKRFAIARGKTLVQDAGLIR